LVLNLGFSVHRPGAPKGAQVPAIDYSFAGPDRTRAFQPFAAPVGLQLGRIREALISGDGLR